MIGISFYLKRSKDAFFYFGASLVKIPISIFSSPLFAKNLSASEFAKIGYFNNLSIFLMPIMAMMFYNYYMTGYHGRSVIENRRILQTLVSFLLLVDVFIVLFAYYLLKLYLKDSGSDFTSYPLGLIVFVTAMFNMGIGFWGIELRFKEKSFKYFILSTSAVLFSTGLGLILVVNCQLGATGRLIPNMFFIVILFFIFFFLFIKQIKIDFLIIKDALRFCYPLIISGILTFPIFYLDKILLERIHNNYEFGLYNIAGTISGYFGMTTNAIIQTFQPDIFKNVSKKYKKPLYQIFVIIVLVFFIGGFVFSLIAPYAVDFLTAGKYVGATKYIIPLIIIVALQPITYFISDIIVALKLTKLELFNQLTIAFLSIGIYYLFIYYFEYFGALYGKIIVLLLFILIMTIEILFRKTELIMHFK